MSAREKTAELCELMRVKYPANAYALLFEVHNGTGAVRKLRSADALAVSLWPSRGVEIIGFEFKSIRSDWQKELSQPEKAEEGLFDYCHRWFLVTSDESIAKQEEIPSPWGWIAAKGGKLLTKKDAPLLEPKPMPLRVMAAIFRRQAEQIEGIGWTHVKRESIQAEIDNAYKRGEKVAEHTINHQKEINKALERRICEFQAATGINVSYPRNDLDRIRRALKIVDAEDFANGLKSRVENICRDLDSFSRKRIELEQLGQYQFDEGGGI